MKIALNRSGVDFNEETHQYFLNGKELRGITSTLLHTAFPDKYLGVSNSSLDHAANRGKLVHRALQDYFSDMFVQSGMAMVGAEAKNLFAREGLTPIEWEYIVTDGEEFASPIDIVCADADGEVVIVDIKTTSELDYAYVAYQTAIYERLFLLQNPALTVKAHYVLWLSVDDDFKFRSRPRLERLPAVSESALDELLEAYHNGTTFNPMRGYTDFPQMVKDVCTQVATYIRQSEEAEKRVDELKQNLFDLMGQYNIKKFENDLLSLTVVPESLSSRLDTVKLKKDHPDICKGYVTTTTRKSYLKITLKNQK